MGCSPQSTVFRDQSLVVAQELVFHFGEWFFKINVIAARRHVDEGGPATILPHSHSGDQGSLVVYFGVIRFSLNEAACFHKLMPFVLCGAHAFFLR
jgi:hypothetical protein